MLTPGVLAWGLQPGPPGKGWGELGERRGEGGLVAALGEILITELPYFKF